MRGLPAGRVTLLVTDIEGSTTLWEDAPAAMDVALRRHDELLHAAVHGCGGVVVVSTGDGLLAAFRSSQAGVQAALRAQRDLGEEDWPTPRPLRVRMGLHTAAQLQPRRDNYHGHDVNLAARIADLGHGGQVLLSQSVVDGPEAVPGGQVRSLGRMPLAGLRGEHQVVQLVADGLADRFPPLRTGRPGRERAGPTLRGHALGPTRVEVDGRVVDEWPRPAARRLVTVLLLSPRHHRRRDELIDLLFGHLDRDAGSRAVSKALSQARSVLDTEDGPSVLVSDGAGVRLRDDLVVEVDLTQHVDALRDALAKPSGGGRPAALRAALAVDGEPLADDADEPWADDPRREVAALRGRARRLLAEDTDSREAWEAVLGAEPTDEVAAVRLVDLHLAAGRRDAAVRVHDACVRALRGLGLEPPRALQEAIAPALAGGVAGPPAPSPPPMTGREAELARLVDLVVTSPPTTIVVTGEAGIGKSLLLAHLRTRLVATGWRTVAAVSVPDDRRLPFVALRGALRQFGSAPEAPPLIQRLRTDRGGTATTVDPVDAAGLAAELEAFLAAQARVAPVAVVLDDLQWADAATQQLVGRLSSSGRVGQWAVVAGWRTGESRAPEPPVSSTGHTLQLEPLPVPSLRDLVGQVGSELPATTQERIIERAGGNPFFVIELARAAAGAADPTGFVLPARLVDTIGQRLAGRSEAAQRLAALVALAGEDATHDRVLAAARILQLAEDHHALLDATEELERADLVRPVDGGLRAGHPLLRDVAEATLSPVRRSLLHRALAEAIAAEDGHTARMSEARHRLAAYEASRLRELAPAAVRSGLGAGHAARAVAGHEVAVGLFRGALALHGELPEAEQEALHDEVVQGMLALGTVLVETRQEQAAEAVLRQARDLAVRPDDRAEAWCQLANIPYRRGDLLVAMGVHEQGLADVGQDPLARARLEGELGWARVRLGQRDGPLGQLRRAAAVLEESGDWGAAGRAVDRLGACVGMWAGTVEEVVQGLDLLDRAGTLCRRANLPGELAVVEMHRARPLALLGRLDEADRALEEAFRLTRETGSIYTMSATHWAAAEIADGRGDLVTALTHRDAEAALLRRCANDHNLAGCEVHRADLLRRLGREDEAVTAQQAALAAAERTGHDRLLADVRAGISPART